MNIAGGGGDPDAAVNRRDVISGVFNAAQEILERELPQSRARAVAITNLETAKLWALEAERGA